jgi:hypothetical protein
VVEWTRQIRASKLDISLIQIVNHSTAPMIEIRHLQKLITKKKAVQVITAFIKSQHATDTGIIYGFSKAECKKLASNPPL